MLTAKRQVVTFAGGGESQRVAGVTLAPPYRYMPSCPTAHRGLLASRQPGR